MDGRGVAVVLPSGQGNVSRSDAQTAATANVEIASPDKAKMMQPLWLQRERV